MTTQAPQSTQQVAARPGRNQIDPRGPRFGAVVTTLVLAIVVAFGPSSPVTAILLAIQVLAFAAATIFGLQAQPYGWIFRKFVRPRIGPPSEFEDQAPPRFAQAVGLIFGLAATAGLLLGFDALFYAAAGMALAAAFLNAAFDFCLGCEMFLLFKRIGVGRKPLTQS